MVPPVFDARVTRGVHIGFAAHARPEVDAFWREGVALGAHADGGEGCRNRYRCARKHLRS